jgi:Asparagine synthase
MLESARGGTLITGNGGDELFGEWRGRAAADLLARRASPSRRGFLALARAAAPPVLRRAWSRRRMRAWLKMPWLSEEGVSRQAAALVREHAAEPSLWRGRIAWRARRRWRALTNASLQHIADDYSVQMAHPLLDPGFVRALAVHGGRLGYGSRTDTTRALFGSVLPPALVQRDTKAWFDDVFWGPASRAFARDWDGRLEDPELAALVAPDAVRSGWLAAIPDARMMLLLQAAHRPSA